MHNLNKEISEKCRLIGCDVRENAPMAEYTTFHIGGPAELLVTTDDPVRAQKVRKLCEAEDIPLLVMGNGSNLLVCDEGVKGVVLRLDGGFALPEIRDGLVVCKAESPEDPVQIRKGQRIIGTRVCIRYSRNGRRCGLYECRRVRRTDFRCT